MTNRISGDGGRDDDGDGDDSRDDDGDDDDSRDDNGDEDGDDRVDKVDNIDDDENLAIFDCPYRCIDSLGCCGSSVGLD